MSAMKKDYNNILFDLDGTLIDTGEGIIDSVKYALNMMNVDFSKVNLNVFVGPPLKKTFISVLKMSEEEANNAVKIFRDYYSKTGLYNCMPYDGMREFLTYLKNKGKKLFVATSKPTIFAVEIIKKMDMFDLFEEIIGSNLDNSRSKKIEILKYIIDKYKFNKEETVLIGDTVFDEVGAKEANINFIGVNYGYGFTPSDSNHYSLKELYNII